MHFLHFDRAVGTFTIKNACLTGVPCITTSAHYVAPNYHVVMVSHPRITPVHHLARRCKTKSSALKWSQLRSVYGEAWR